MHCIYRYFNKSVASQAKARAIVFPCPGVVLPLHIDNCSIIIQLHTAMLQIYIYKTYLWSVVLLTTGYIWCWMLLLSEISGQLSFLRSLQLARDQSAVRASVAIWLQFTFIHAGWQHQRSPCSNDCDAGSPLGCHNDRVRRYNVMPSDTMMMRVMMDAPTSDHVAIWYSMRGLGVVVTGTVKHFCIMQLCKIS